MNTDNRPVVAVLAVLLLASTRVSAASTEAVAPRSGAMVAAPAVRVLLDDALALHRRGETESALARYREAASLGDANAQFNAAVIRLSGDSESLPLSEALVLLRRSAEQGYPPAEYALATALENGLDAPGPEHRQ
ncbi:MAG: hypothetical protein R3E48_22765 [Burkholderiaceae bacterium]